MVSHAVPFLSLNAKNSPLEIEELKYPIGKYETPDTIDDEVFSGWVDTLEKVPERLKKLVGNLSYDKLELNYRPGSWNIKQVVHHMADSHMNGFIRMKWTLTEDNPEIKVYDQVAWAETEDAGSEEIMESIEILEGLHNRMVLLLRSLNENQRKRTFRDPRQPDKEFSLEHMVGMYVWHSRHHLAHIKQAIEKEGEFTPESSS